MAGQQVDGFFVTPVATRHQIFQGMHDSPEFNLPENEVFTRTKPRASALLGDARETAYMMAGVPKTDPNRDNPEREDLIFTQETGRLAEDLTREGIKQAVGVDFDTDIALPEDSFVTGHPDGQAVVDGALWGFEHKLLGRFQYRKMTQFGLLSGYPSLLAQTLCYGYHLDWEYAQMVVASQDASSIRVESYRGKWTQNDNEFHPKMRVFAIHLPPLYDLYIPELRRRAEWFTEWAATSGDPKDVAIERSDLDSFPWSYSEWVSQAREDGQSGELPPAGSLLALDHAK